MRRREVVAGAGALLVGGAALALTHDGSDPDGVAPVRLSQFVPASGRWEPADVPARGTVSVVEFFATWCHVCEASMEPLAAVHRDLGGSVQFVSVTNQPEGHALTRPELRDWWLGHDATWPVAFDADLQLTDALDATGVPTTAVLDARNVVTWTHTGLVDADDLREQVRLAGEGA